ncbi:MAG: hypothetical protein WBV82_28375 [Myxococcaceae bacterium]
MSCRQGEAGADAPQARPPAEQPEIPVAPGQYAVTPEAVDRYLAFQDRSLKLHGETVRELIALEQRDAGTGPEAAALVRRQAEAVMALRQEAGLTDRDVRELERIVGDVISRRALAATAEEAAALSDLENLAARLSDADRTALETSLASVREQQRALEALTEERKRYGDANVDAVLSRERELTRLWQRTIVTFAAAGADAAGDAGTPARSRR